MPKTIALSASLHRIAIDAEGESTIQFKVPLSELTAILKIAEYTEVELRLAITPQEEQAEFLKEARG